MKRRTVCEFKLQYRVQLTLKKKKMKETKILITKIKCDAGKKKKKDASQVGEETEKHYTN